MNYKKLAGKRKVKDGLTRSERYNRNSERIFAAAERFDQNQMNWLRQQGVSEDEIQNAKRNTGLHGSELSKLVIRIARENGDTRENSDILGEAMGISDSRRVKDAQKPTATRQNSLLYGDDDAWKEAERLMDMYSKEGVWNAINSKNYDAVLGVTKRVIREFGEIKYPDEMFYYLEDANYHALNDVLALEGKLGEYWKEEEIKTILKWCNSDDWFKYLCKIYHLKVTDSRRVKDANLNSYGYEDNGGYYGEDFELADEEDDEVIELMNNYLELVEQYNIDFNKSSVKEFKDFYYAVIDMASNFDFINPQYIDDQLTEANYHTLNRCITIAGFFGEKEQQQLVNSWKRDLKNIKQYMNVPRMKAFTEIMQDMGLI